MTENVLMGCDKAGVIITDRRITPAIAVNSMIIGSRDFEEAFELVSRQ